MSSVMKIRYQTYEENAMSNADSQICEKCGRPCGYDDGKGYYDPGYICRQCKYNLIKRFASVFGLEGASSDDWGLQISWRDADRILSKLRRDERMRISYYVSDKELYQRTSDSPSSQTNSP